MYNIAKKLKINSKIIKGLRNYTINNVNYNNVWCKVNVNIKINVWDNLKWHIGTNIINLENKKYLE